MSDTHSTQGSAETTADGKPTKYVRAHTWVMPFLSLPTKASFVFTVPIDDNSAVMYGVDAREVEDERERERRADQYHYGRAGHHDQ